MPLQVICHGGAWSIPDEAEKKSQEGVREAAKAGFDALKAGQDWSHFYGFLTKFAKRPVRNDFFSVQKNKYF